MRVSGYAAVRTALHTQPQATASLWPAPGLVPHRHTPSSGLKTSNFAYRDEAKQRAWER
ncbi:MAG: hypothetical protein M3186_08340 [Actinomycetota bacterium]|nr:hypothetical protein [Actinomycetota bacterium]